jgi:hypothetical protein
MIIFPKTVAAILQISIKNKKGYRVKTAYLHLN